MIRFYFILILAIICCGLFQGCTNRTSNILYINSYHQGYPSGDSILAGIKYVLNDKKPELQTVYMDTKRQQGKEHIREKVDQILALVNQTNPDIIIASDDNAVKYIIKPHFNKSSIPVVFCGVNWSAKQYELSPENITGMLETLPLPQLLQIVKKYYPDKNRLFVLTENSTSAKNNREILDTLFQNEGFVTEYALVDSFEHWKTGFINANENHDILYVPTNGAIKNWDNEIAKAFVKSNIQIPVITCDDFMMDYAALGLTKVAKEQGIWSAGTALKILAGEKVSNIPITKNQQYNSWINKPLADSIDLEFEPAFLSDAKMINE